MIYVIKYTSELETDTAYYWTRHVDNTLFYVNFKDSNIHSYK